MALSVTKPNLEKHYREPGAGGSGNYGPLERLAPPPTSPARHSCRASGVHMAALVRKLQAIVNVTDSSL